MTHALLLLLVDEFDSNAPDLFQNEDGAVKVQVVVKKTKLQYPPSVYQISLLLWIRSKTLLVLLHYKYKGTNPIEVPLLFGTI